MTNDAYWDELGFAWVAVVPNLTNITPRLTNRIRRQTWLFRAGFVASAVLSLSGLLLGVWTIWLGITTGAWNFVTRGMAIVVIGLFAAIAAHAFWSDGANGDGSPVSEMIDLAVIRARRLLLTVRLSLYACTVAAVFGVIGSVIRSSLAKPPNMSPVVDVILLALAVVGLALYGRSVKVELAKFEYLKRALADG